MSSNTAASSTAATATSATSTQSVNSSLSQTSTTGTQNAVQSQQNQGTGSNTATVPEGNSGEVDVDSIIERLLEVRGSRPGKQVQLAEHEIKFLCTKSREIFISQPILLELEAPIKICGKFV
jgi:hypothetical protein